MKRKVEFGEERREGKCFKLKDLKDVGEEKSQAVDVEKTQVKENVIASMRARSNEESKSQVKAEYEEGSRRQHIVETSTASEAKVLIISLEITISSPVWLKSHKGTMLKFSIFRLL